MGSTCKSFLLGIGLCVCILALLFGVDGLTREARNKRRHEETKSYGIPRNCTIISVSTRRDRGGLTSSPCLYYLYLLQVQEAPTGGSSSGSGGAVDPGLVLVRHAYSNFYDELCGGFLVPNVSTSIGTVIPCWLSEDSASSSGPSTLVRVSPIMSRNYAYLAYGVTAVVLGGALLLIFFGYNCFLCAVGCCVANEDNERRRRDRNLSLARIERAMENAPPVPMTMSMQTTPGVRHVVTESGAYQQHSEPFEVPNVDDLTREGHDWKSRFTGNSYAEGVISGLRKLKRKLHLTKPEAQPGASPSGRDTSGVAEMAERRNNRSRQQEALHDRVGSGVSTSAEPYAVITPAESAHGGGAAVFVEDCQICFEHLSTAVVIFPCAHHICDHCAANLLSESYCGYVSYIRCPTCRTEHQDSTLLRFALTEDPASGERFYRSGQVSMATSRYTSPREPEHMMAVSPAAISPTMQVPPQSLITHTGTGGHAPVATASAEVEDTAGGGGGGGGNHQGTTATSPNLPTIAARGQPDTHLPHLQRSTRH